MLAISILPLRHSAGATCIFPEQNPARLYPTGSNDATGATPRTTPPTLTTMCFVRLPPIPTEIWGCVIACVSQLRDLCSLCLVCRDWQLLALPQLYRTMHLVSVTHVERIASQIANGAPLSGYIHEYLRNLMVDRLILTSDDGPNGSESSVEKILLVVAHAPNLQHFSWRVPRTNKGHRLWGVLRSSCRDLRRLEVRSTSELEYYSEASPSKSMICGLQHLTHLNLYAGLENPGPHDGTTETLGLMLRNSPNLHSVELCFRKNSFATGDWSPSELFFALQDTTLTHLHTLRILGDISRDWYTTFTETNPTGHFFLRHRSIHTLGLGCVELSGEEETFEPEVAAALFPLLTCFTAPNFLCRPVMASNLAAQLQHVVVNSYWMGPTIDCFSGMIVPKAELITLDARGQIDPNLLKQLLCCTPLLKTLYFSSVVASLDEVLSILELAPNLQVVEACIARLIASSSGAMRLPVRISPYPNSLGLSFGIGSWQEFVLALANLCLNLRRVVDHHSRFEWAVQRNGEMVTVVPTRYETGD